MLIQHKEINSQGIFYIIDDDGRQKAELIYTLTSPDKMVIEHTEVDDSLKGKNVGTDMVLAAVHYARTKHLKIVPNCPFARLILKRHTEFSDVLAEPV